MQQRLFDSLVTLREQSVHGSGEVPYLGLYVVRLVAEIHRGAGYARNLADGDGFEFAMLLHGMPRRP